MDRLRHRDPLLEVETPHPSIDHALPLSPVRSAQPHARPLRDRQPVHGSKEQVDPLVLGIEATDPEQQPFASSVPMDVTGNIDSVGCDDNIASISEPGDVVAL